MRIRYTPKSVSPSQANNNTLALSTLIVALLIKTLEHVGTIAYSLPINQIIPLSHVTSADPYQQQQQYSLYYQHRPDENRGIHMLDVYVMH